VFGRVAVLALLIGFASAAQSRLPAEPKALSREGFVPLPQVADLLAFGLEPVVADLHWLRAVQIVGTRGVGIADGADQIGRLIDVVTTLNPWVSHPYRFAAVWMADDEEHVREAIRLLDRGIEHHPDDWRMYFYKGFDQFYYLNEHEAAAETLARAVALPGSPSYLGRLVARLRSVTGDLDAAELFLRQMLTTADNEELEAQYRGALDEIQVERRARLLDRARKAWRRLHGRDIGSVADLVDGEGAVLRALPPAFPSSLPPGLRRGHRWVLDPETDRIVSTWAGARYEVHLQPVHRERVAELGADGASEAGAGAGSEQEERP